MPKILYIEKNFSDATMETVIAADEIIEAYQAKGFKLTLRQLYYQFVSRGLIPNDQKQYKRLGKIVNDARLAGFLDWEAIEDRTRELEKLNSWAGPHSILQASANSFRRDRWAFQPYRIEVWIEKEALAGVFQGICEELEVPFFCCRGYPSQSEVWRASCRLLEYEAKGQTPIILHFGDHDPSGIDMTRDIVDRMGIFGLDLEVDRLALNMDQVEEFHPPPNPAKLTDARIAGYIQRFGRSSWELDALNPETLADLVAEAVLGFRDDEIWEETLQEDEKSVETLNWLARNWTRVLKMREEQEDA